MDKGDCPNYTRASQSQPKTSHTLHEGLSHDINIIYYELNGQIENWRCHKAAAEKQLALNAAAEKQLRCEHVNRRLRDNIRLLSMNTGTGLLKNSSRIGPSKNLLLKKFIT